MILRDFIKDLLKQLPGDEVLLNKLGSHNSGGKEATKIEILHVAMSFLANDGDQNNLDGVPSLKDLALKAQKANFLANFSSKDLADKILKNLPEGEVYKTTFSKIWLENKHTPFPSPKDLKSNIFNNLDSEENKMIILQSYLGARGKEPELPTEGFAELLAGFADDKKIEACGKMVKKWECAQGEIKDVLKLFETDSSKYAALNLLKEGRKSKIDFSDIESLFQEKTYQKMVNKLLEDKAPSANPKGASVKSKSSICVIS